MQKFETKRDTQVKESRKDNRKGHSSIGCGNPSWSKNMRYCKAIYAGEDR